MKAIYKYRIVEGGGGQIKAHIIRFLRVQHQDTMTCVWAQIDTDIIDDNWYIVAVGTGEPLPITCDDWVYIDTLQEEGTGYVWHYFGIKRNSEDRYQ